MSAKAKLRVHRGAPGRTCLHQGQLASLPVVGQRVRETPAQKQRLDRRLLQIQNESSESPPKRSSRRISTFFFFGKGSRVGCL